MPYLEPVRVNGFNIYPFKSKEKFLEYLINGNWFNILIALNAEKLIREDANLRNLVNKNVGYSDGVGAVLALKKKGAVVEKIPGAEFWLDIIDAFHQKKTFYLIGGKPEVMVDTVQKLKKQFPDLNLAGYRDGYFNEEEYKALKKDIFLKKPDAVFVAMGSPTQEFIMQELQNQHKALYMGLGGSFDVYTGHVERAPELWINLNLEWAYRLFKQPKRIFRQWVYIKFMYRLLANRL